LLFRWFVGLEIDEPVWNHAVFSKNRDRLLNEETARDFFARVLEQAEPHLSKEHFTVDGTLIEAWASQKSFQPKDGGDDDGTNFHGQQRRNDTHESKTDRDARLYRKGHGQEAKLSYLGHVVVENRNALIVDTLATTADGKAEADAALLMAAALREQRPHGRITLGADKAYDQRELVENLRALGVTAHIAQNTKRRRSALDRRTTRHVSYSLSQRCRPLIEKVFGWLKPIGGLRKVKLRGLDKVSWLVRYTAAAYNLWRLPKLQAQPA
jgi:IS5 family transposase